MKKKFIAELLKGLGAVRRPRRIASAALRTDSGQSLMELAYMVPVLLLLTVGIIEVGRFAYYAILVATRRALERNTPLRV